MFFLVFIHFSLAAQDNCQPPSVTNYLAYGRDSISELKRHDQTLGSMRDQDGIGYCYAYTASDMLEQWLKKNKQLKHNQELSPMGLGLKYQSNNWNRVSSFFREFAHQNKYIQDRVKFYQDLIDKKQVELNSVNERFRLHPEVNNVNNVEVINLMGQSRGLGQLIRSYQDEIKKLTSSSPEVLQDLFPDTTLDDLVPERGAEGELLQNLAKELCLEEEVSSRDNSLNNEILDYINSTTLYNSIGLKNLRSIQNILQTDRFNPQGISCESFNFLKDIFPNLPFQSIPEYQGFLEKLEEEEQLFDSLLNLSCTSFELKKMPEIKTDKVAIGFPLESRNERLIAMIDQALDQGKIAGIGYRSQILERYKMDELSNDYHASTITGRLNICGKKHYILRNSWGREACSRFQKTYLNSASNPPLKLLQDERERCILSAETKAKSQTRRCQEDCLIKREKKRAKYIQECLETFNEKAASYNKDPYYCDSEGNFIVSEGLLKKGLFRTSYIKN